MRIRLLVFASMAVLSAPAMASTKVPSNSGQAWRHAATGLVLPPTVAGLERTSIDYLSAPEVDVSGTYSSADGNDMITVYLFRDVALNVPVWFDRARFFIMNLPDKYGFPVATGIRPFIPRGQSVASGLMETYRPTTGARSTGLMVLPLNGFYAKIRMSSKTRDSGELEKLIIAAVNAFNWSTKTPVNAAAPVSDCPQPLLVRAAAKPVTMNDDDRMMAGLLGGVFAGVVVDETGKQAAESPQTFCREPGPASLSFGVYRNDAQGAQYVLAVHDAGRVITVGRNGLSELVHSEARADAKTEAEPARFTISFVELHRTQVFSDFETLPLPEQAVEEVEKNQPVSITGTWGKDRANTTIITR